MWEIWLLCSLFWYHSNAVLIERIDRQFIRRSPDDKKLCRMTNSQWPYFQTTCRNGIRIESLPLDDWREADINFWVDNSEHTTSNLNNLSMLGNQRPGINIWSYGEAPTMYAKEMLNKSHVDLFDYTASYRLDAALRFTSFCPLDTYNTPSLCWIGHRMQKEIPFDKKVGFAVASWSNCAEPVRNRYLSDMTLYAQQIYNVKVSQMGKCQQNDFSLTTPRNYTLGQKLFKAEVIKLSRPYKFSLVFQNNDCEYFIDDRLSMAFAAHTIPVVMAHTPSVKKVLGDILSRSVIWVSDFRNPHDLVDYLHSVANSKSLYNSYMIRPKDFPHISAHYTQIFTGIRERLFCAACVLAFETQSWGSVISSFVGPDLCPLRSSARWIRE